MSPPKAGTDALDRGLYPQVAGSRCCDFHGLALAWSLLSPWISMRQLDKPTIRYRTDDEPPYVVTMASWYEMACVTSVIGLLLAVAVAVGW
jgi:hypothetical protein